jgi:hypothetical protein
VSQLLKQIDSESKKPAGTNSEAAGAEQSEDAAESAGGE